MSHCGIKNTDMVGFPVSDGEMGMRIEELSLRHTGKDQLYTMHHFSLNSPHCKDTTIDSQNHDYSPQNSSAPCSTLTSNIVVGW